MSNCGMKYILVLYDYNNNAILAKAMKTNKGQAITDAYNELHTELMDAGITPILQYLDNETSKELIALIKSKFAELCPEFVCNPGVCGHPVTD